MDKDNVKKFPITYSQRRKNTFGPLQVECQVSGRYLKFSDKSSLLQGGEFITFDVMTMAIDGESSKKICQMIVTREDLLEALANITPGEPQDTQGGNL